MVRRFPGGRPKLMALAWLCALTLAVPCFPATPEEVDKAVQKGQEFLYSKLGKDGTWEEVPKPELSTAKEGKWTDLKARQWGGITSIATYALLASGENPQEAKLKPAIDFLSKANIHSTYGLGLSSQVWLLTPASAQTRAVMAHDVQMIDSGMIKKGVDAGFYGYWTGSKLGTDEAHWSTAAGYAPQPKGWHDLSNSQYAILGMWALDQAGAEVPTEFWKTADAAWKKAQEADGSWKYNSGKEPSAAMTAAGIATLFITQDYTATDTWSACRGGAPTPQIDKGMEWMDKAIEKVVEDGDFYTMYGIERIGVASGRKYIGAIDWYQRGADTLVHKQKKDGSWGGGIPDTCFSMLFLSRGRAPIMMNKLQYETPRAIAGVTNVWAERPRDVANLARWSGRQLEHDLNWQIVNMEVSPDDLHDAPVLYISGSQQLAFSPAKLAKMREFVEQGGMILGNADCGKQEFIKSFTRLGADLFPRYEFRQLPPNHPIYTHEQYPATGWKVRPTVLGLTNGVREFMVLLPDSDPSRAWQTQNDRTHEELFQLGADIFLYAIDKKNLLNKGETYIVNPDPKIVATKKIKIARLMAGPNPDPEPGGWRRLAAIMHNREKIDLNLFDTKAGDGSLIAARIAHLTGTTSFKLTDAARLEIKTFVQSGGTLIIDAAGGSAEFASSAENELRQMFGPAATELEAPLPMTSPLYNQMGHQIMNASYRVFARQTLPRGTKTPLIRGITFGNKIRVFLSPVDITGGLVGQPVDGVYGYNPPDAVELMSAMIRYAASK
jgi:hypothetical protein